MQQVATGNSTADVSNVLHAGAPGPGQTIIITSLSQTILQPIVSNIQPQQKSTGAGPGATGQMVQPILPATSSVSTMVLSQVVQDSLVHSQTSMLQTKSTGHVISAGHFQCSSTEDGTGTNPANMEHDSVQKPEHPLQSCMFQSAGRSNLPFQTQTSRLPSQTSVLHPQTSGLQTQTTGLQTHTSSLQQHHHPYPQQQQQQQNVFTQLNQNGLGHTQMDQSNQGQSSNTLFSENSHLASHSMPPVTSVQGLTACQGNTSSLGTPATFSQHDTKLFHFPQGFSQSRSDAYSQDSSPQMGRFTQHQQEMFPGVAFAPSQPAASTPQQTLISASSQQPFSNFTSGSERVCQTYNNPSSVRYEAAAAGDGVSGRTAWSTPNTSQYAQKAAVADPQTKHASQLPQDQQTRDKVTAPPNRQPQNLKIKCSPPPRAPEVKVITKSQYMAVKTPNFWGLVFLVYW